jgi:hypothetical protein
VRPTGQHFPIIHAQSKRHGRFHVEKSFAPGVWDQPPMSSIFGNHAQNEVGGAYHCTVFDRLL